MEPQLWLMSVLASASAKATARSFRLKSPRGRQFHRSSDRESGSLPPGEFRSCASNGGRAGHLGRVTPDQRKHPAITASLRSDAAHFTGIGAQLQRSTQQFCGKQFLSPNSLAGSSDRVQRQAKRWFDSQTSATGRRCVPVRHQFLDSLAYIGRDIVHRSIKQVR